MKATPRDIVLSHGGSFRDAPSKAMFWMPNDMADGWLEQMLDSLAALDTSAKATKRVENGWTLWRFTGERKGFKTVRVVDRNATNNVNPNLILRISRDGVIEIREKGRKTGFTTTACAVYVRCMLNEVLKRNAEKARSRKRRKKH